MDNMERFRQFVMTLDELEVAPGMSPSETESRGLCGTLLFAEPNDGSGIPPIKTEPFIRCGTPYLYAVEARHEPDAPPTKAKKQRTRFLARCSIRVRIAISWVRLTKDLRKMREDFLRRVNNARR